MEMEENSILEFQFMTFSEENLDFIGSSNKITLAIYLHYFTQT